MRIESNDGREVPEKKVATSSALASKGSPLMRKE